MTPTQLRALRREITRTRKLAHGMEQAAQQMLRDLEGFDSLLAHHIEQMQPATDATAREPRARAKAVSANQQRDLHRLLDEFLSNL